MQTQEGFTLFEFVLVLLIGSILWGLSLRGMHHLNSFKASLIYEEIIQLLNLGHKISKVSNKPVTIYCSNKHVYLSEKFSHFILQEGAGTIAVPQAITLNCSSEITFWPNGRVIANGTPAEMLQWSVAEYDISIDGHTAYVY
jgi:prepilin-type N-terminal cleavage/methylation domain-containing protein